MASLNESGKQGVAFDGFCRPALLHGVTLPQRVPPIVSFDIQLSSVETDIFQNPRPLFPAVDCPVIWEWAVCDQHAHVDVTLSCLEGASSYLQQEVSYHFEGEKEDSGEDLPDVFGAIEAAEESDSGSEEVYEDKATFKCLGCTKERTYQECLKAAREKMEQDTFVPIRLLKENSNPVDQQAVSFQCQLQQGGGWTTFGYVARELTGYVRKAMDSNQVRSVSFKWVKWRSWARSGMGYYAAIDVVIRGCWAHALHAKSSF
ncbi:uncharacterized protein LOC134198488 isoform X2 [Corticium candelabrum]|uniref:uncharacterized protein LOC134198488 isoform X2 n=1 Tax=Corticium candelabrum TaxID=121492 RepID=UPI002E26B526|nr:uncharacterized protein LOC134198488 isoform X2 [Corticium candelabrum]XP_062523882.1 uncharacterized protein LOC134198488 isoform X2 [Corticium candelabrum]